MPNFGPALISFSELIGVLGEDGVVKWLWFADPLNQSLKGLPANRANIGEIIRAILERTYPGADQPFEGNTFVWEPINLGSDVQVGFVLTASGDLDIGIGGKAAFQIGGEDISAFVLAKLLKISPSGNLSGLFGKVRFGGTVPMPDFLKPATLAGDTDPSFAVSLTVQDTDERTRTLAYPNNVIAWDAARLALFVLQAWVHKKALETPTTPPGFFGRIDRHLFPMLGDPESPPNNPTIRSFPLVGETMGQPFDITNWKNSVFTTANGAAGALTFLWHLRALLTGNENANFFEASYHFPLVGGPEGGNPPTLADAQTPYAPGPNSAWLSMSTANNIMSLSLDIYDDTGTGLPPIVLGTVNNGTFTRPQLGQSALTALQAYLSSHPINIGGGQITATLDGNAVRVNLLGGTVTGSGFEGFDGQYSAQLYLAPNQPVAYKMKAPLFEIQLPPVGNPADGKAIFAMVAHWLLSSIPDANNALGKVPGAVADFVRDTINNNGNVDPLPLITAVAELIGNGQQIKIGDPFAIKLENGHIKPELKIGPVKPGDLGDLPVHIGQIGVSADLAISLNQCSFSGFTVSLSDVRFGQGGGTSSNPTGLIASLLPDMRGTPGFHFSLGYQAPGTVKVTGGGKIPIQQSIGPLNIAALMVDIRDTSISVGIDLTFQLAMITVAAYELGIQFPFNGTPTPFLHGLGLSFNTGGIKLAGMFAEMKTPGKAESDYVGGATVSVVNMFELSAIGGYTEVDGQASLFIFASLVAPLGGPPWFFITGVAGGFGYNRSLPPAGLLVDHPFMKVMRGELDINGTATEALQKLSVHFAAVKDQHWIAAGIQFTCFGFINGKVVVAVGFGHKFSLTILGLASFGISPIAYFELGIECTADEEKFLLKAGLSKNSYIIHPDIFSLRGDFALGIWHKAPNAGDFVLSIGGYHPYFETPAHYPDLARVGCKAIVYGFIRMSVEVFFACTPQAIMAGASVSLSAEFMGIGAGLDVYLDVFIRWDPFFLQATLGVTVWFEFFGRHEVGVELRIHTPPLGGTALIDLALVSFEIDFGHQLDGTPTPAIYEFLTRTVGVPAMLTDGKARVAKFNTADKAGLFRVDFLSGRPAKPEQNDSAKQEGVDTPVVLAAEFAFSVKSRLPIKEIDIDSAAPVPVNLVGEVDLPLCKKMDLDSQLTVTANNIAQSARQRLSDFFPAASFGEELKGAQADGARQAVGKVDPKKAAIALTEGIVYDYKATPEPIAPTALAGKQLEYSQNEQDYPLPLGTPDPSMGTLLPKMTTFFAMAAPSVKFSKKTAVPGRRDAALAQVQTRKTSPFFVVLMAGDMQRMSVPMKVKNLKVSSVPTGAVTMAVPKSPARRAEMFSINLRTTNPTTAVKLTQPRLEAVRKAPNFSSKALTPRGGATGAFKTSFSVAPGKALNVDLTGGRVKKHTLALTGSQVVRAILLGGADDPIIDTYVSGTSTLNVPTRARRVVFVGEGMEPAVMPVAGVAGVPPMAQEAIGVEHDSVLLALGRRIYAGHGCLLEVNNVLEVYPNALDSAPGFRVLEAANSLRLYFPVVKKGWTLMIAVQPVTPVAGSAVEEIRWASLDAELGTLVTVIGPDATAFLMPVTATKPWTLDIDLGKNWRVRNVVVCGMTQRDLGNLLKSRGDWDLVDDRFTQSTTVPGTNIVMEVA